MNIEKLLVSLEKKLKIEENILMQLIDKVSEVLVEEPNVIDVKAPINVCGDLHG